jgi:putative ABC transport system substrate-binding protein
MIRRRNFIKLLGGAAAWPLAARAQQGGRVRRVCVLMPRDESDPVTKTYVSAFTQVLADLGWTDGHNMRMDLRWGGEDNNRIRALAQELVGLQPDIIVTSGALAKPVTFPPGWLSRGTMPTFQATLGGKWLELLSEIAPGLKRAAILFNPDLPAVSAYVPSLEQAARSFKVVPMIAPVRSDLEIETAIIGIGREPGGGVVVIPDIFMAAHRAPIISAAPETTYRQSIPYLTSPETAVCSTTGSTG